MHPLHPLESGIKRATWRSMGHYRVQMTTLFIPFHCSKADWHPSLVVNTPVCYSLFAKDLVVIL